MDLVAALRPIIAPVRLFFSRLALLLSTLWMTFPAAPVAAPDEAALVAVASEAEEHTPELELQADAILSTALELDPPEETAATLQGILSAEDFITGGPTGPSLLERLSSYILGLLSRLNLGPAGGAFYYIGLVLIAIIAALIVYLAVRMLWDFFGLRAADSAGKSAAGEERFTTENWLSAAEEAWQRGDFRSAIRFRFKAVLSMIELPRSATLTNYQIARLVGRDHPSLRPALLELVTRFEDAWYGGLPAGAVDYERVASLAGGIEQTYRLRQVQQ